MQGVGMAADPHGAAILWEQLLATEPCVAAFELAKLYEGGTGVEQSLFKAAEYFRMARSAGHPDAYRNLRRIGAES